MTVFNPQDWSRQAKIDVDGTAFSGTNAHAVMLLTQDEFLASAAEAITLGDANAIQSNGADLRFTTDQAGLNQVPAYVVPESVSLDATPANSTLRVYIYLANLETNVSQEVWMHWKPVAPATPEAEAGTYGRNETFLNRYQTFWGMQEDPGVVSGFPDWTGVRDDLATTGSTVGADSGHPFGQWVTEVATLTNFTTNMDATGDVGWAHHISTADRNFFVSDLVSGGGLGYRRTLPSESQLRNGGIVNISNPPSEDVAFQYTRIGSVDKAYFNASLDSQRTGVTFSSELELLFVDQQDASSDFVSHLRYFKSGFDDNWIGDEYTLFYEQGSYITVNTPQDSAADATFTFENVPAGGRLAAFKTSDSTEFDQIASTAAGSNELTGSVTGFLDLDLTFVPATGYRVWQSTLQLPATGATLDISEVLQADVVHRTADETLTDGVEFTLAPGSSNLTLNQAVASRALYSSTVQTFRDSATLCANLFPMAAIERAWYRVKDSWSLLSDENLQTAGYDVVTGGVSDTVQESHVGNRSLGDLTGTTVYYSLAGGAAVQLPAPGAFDKPIQVYQNGGTDNRLNDVAFFARQHGRAFDLSSVLSIGGSLAEPNSFVHALSTSTVDVDIVDDVATVDSSTPYTGMSVTSYTAQLQGAWIISTTYALHDLVQSSGGRWFRCTVPGTSSGDDSDLAGGSDTGVTWEVYAGEREISGAWHAFDTVIDANSGDPQQVHTYAQRRLLFDGPDNLRQTQYGAFLSGTYTTTTGVYVDSLVGNAQFTDLEDVVRIPPLSVTVKITCVETDGTPVEGARVFLEAGAGGPLSLGTVIIDGELTNASGIVQASFDYTADQPLQRSRARKVGATNYKNAPIQGTITTGGFETTVVMIEE